MFKTNNISLTNNKFKNISTSRKNIIYSTEEEVYNNNDEHPVPVKEKNININFNKHSDNTLKKILNLNPKTDIMISNHKFKNIGNFKLKNIIIFTRVYTLFAAETFKKYFEKCGITTNIKVDSIENTDIKNCYNDDSLFYLLIGPQYLFEECKTKKNDLIKLPSNKYFIYEIEQFSQQFNLNLMDEYKHLTSEPVFEFNYSILNFDYYNSKSKIIITPLIDDSNIGKINLNKEIDILFVGNISEYRTEIIDSIKERGYNITIVNRKVGNELYEIVKKSKIIINIHYYKDSVFEVFRIHDFLPFDCNIISEPPENEKEKYLINVYKDVVDFFDSKDEMFKIIESNLNKKPNMIVRKNFITSMNSKNKALINFNILGSLLVEKYSNLFHKYVIRLSNPNTNIEYRVDNYLPVINNNQLLCHLHCKDISNFNTIYRKYLVNLKKYFNIFITYTFGIVNKEMLNLFNILKVSEQGTHIGSKFCFLDFIDKTNIEYSHILFLHDALEVNFQNKYFEIIDEKYLPFTLNSIHEDKDGIFPNLLTGINSESKDMLLNKIYIEEILNYLNINNKPNYFVKGDCMVLSKRIVNRVFLDNKNLFYNILNNKNNNSFDLNWVRWYYKINQNLENTYNLYKKNKLFGNNLSNTFTNSININNFDINTLASKPFTGNNYSHSMIEYVFEKIYLTVIDSFEGGSYITTGTEKKRIEQEEIRIKKERLERVSQLENSLNLVIEKISTMEYENSERHKKIVFDIDNQEKLIEINNNNFLNSHNNYKIKTLEIINDDREKEVSKKNKIYSETSNDIKLSNEEINSENLKNDNEITRIDREKNIVEEMCKEIDEEIENEKNMEIERRKKESEWIEQEKLNEIERRKKESEWIEQERINEIQRRENEKIRIKNEKALEIKKRSDFEKNIRLQRKLEKERRAREDDRFLREELIEVDRIPIQDKRIENLKIKALKKIPLEDERLDNLEKDEQTRILREKQRIDKRKSDEEINRPKRKKSIDELYLQQSKKYKEKINIINLKAEQKNKELKTIEEEIKNLNTLYNDKFKAEEEKLDKILENINIDYQNKLNHIELLKSKEVEEEKIQNNILIEKKEPLLLEKNNIDIELSKLKNLLDGTYQKVDIENYIKQNLSSETLFHKYKLGLAYPKDKINYEVIQNNTSIEFKQRKYYAHLHCFDISRFNEIYGQYIDKISQYFSLVITYSIGENTIDKINSCVILKIPNKGMDIGAKFCAVAYLNDNKISHEYILFLHSKSNPDTRRKYFEPLINNLSDRFIENINQNDGYFPDIEWEIVGDRLKWVSNNPEFKNHENTNWPERNLLYRNELLKYLGANNNTNHFIEGNCYILSRNVIDNLYSDSNLYNILNNETSFDYNWVSKAYNIPGNIYEVYKQFLKRKLAPRFKNNLSRDGYIEHVFERVVLNFCSNYKILKEIQYDSIKNLKEEDKILIIHTQYGLGNRLRALASAYSICKIKNYKLIINWIPDNHCDCLIEELIDNVGNFGETIYKEIDINTIKNLKIYNYLETENGGKKDEYIDDKYNKIYVKSNSILNNKYSFKYFENFLQSLKWNNSINNLINSISHINDYIGMHIRMEGGANYTSQSYEKESNWTKNETELLFKYRELSHINNFINQINNILHKNPEQKFFIATDMKSNYEKLINIYGNDKIKILERNNYDRSKEQLYYALADMILLSRCNQFYGSTWSSFSELVTYFQKDEVKKQNVFSNDFKLNDINKYIDKTLLNLPILEGNSILLGCRNRLENLLKVLKAIIHYPNIDEIVIVDWNSDEHLYKNKYIIDIRKKEPKIKIYTVANVDKWTHTKVWNMGLLLSRYENIYKIDCEVIPNKDFISQHKLNDNIFYHGHWVDPNTNKVKEPIRLQIVGSIFCKRKNLLAINLWNENIKTYGWEDSDLYNRLKKIINYKYIDDTEFNFIVDNDINKNYYNEKEMLTPNMRIQKNRILCDDYQIYTWNKYNLVSEFELVDSENYIFKLIDVEYSLNEKFINKKILNDINKSLSDI